MPRDFFDPAPEEPIIVLVDAAAVRRAERMIESCEHCNPDEAQIPFDAVLDRVTNSDPAVTDYLIQEPAQCPRCRRQIFEKTLVEPSFSLGAQ